LIVTGSPTAAARRALIIALADRYRLPAVYAQRYYVTRGGCRTPLGRVSPEAPEIVDAETAELKRRAGHFYAGLLLASPFAPAHKSVMLAGYRQNGEINVRSQDDFEPVIPSIVRNYPAVTFAELQLAAKIASQIAVMKPPR
jgi:hypothetical protein